MNKKIQNKSFIKNLIVKGARENNLKNISIEIPRNNFVVITGLSGSGKSSLAFNTIYAEGQRRYVESLSAYARQFLGVMEKPKVDYIEGLSPAISIEQKTTNRNPRSTIGTITEIYDYLRLLFARVGKQHCPKCKNEVDNQTPQQIVDSILKLKDGTKFQILSPIVIQKKGEFKDVLAGIAKQGFQRLRINNEIKDISDKIFLKKTAKHTIEIVVDRLIMNKSIKDRLTASIELALKMGRGVVTINFVKSKKDIFFSQNFACIKCNISFEKLEPRLFSFNSPFGACKKCDGLGTLLNIDPDLIVTDNNLSISRGAIRPIGENLGGRWSESKLKSLSEKYSFSLHEPWKLINPEIQNIILYGDKKKINVNYSSKSFKGEYSTKYEGIIPRLNRRYKQTRSGYIRSWIENFMSVQDCASCQGSRLSPNSLSVFIEDKNINDIVNQNIKSLSEFIISLKLNRQGHEIAKPIITEIASRLEFLINVGLSYLTLNRSASTLSGGEAQRIRLATQIGSQLMGVLYILDEPSIGLHQRDNIKLIKTLQYLRDIGNTIIVVEHDKDAMLASDWIIDIGPGAGINGGEVVFSGEPRSIMKNKKSLTGKYLSGVKSIPLPKEYRKGNKKFIHLTGARGNNLKDLSISIPLSKFVCVTGVSGSGKSTLINQTLFPILSRELFSSNLKPLDFSNIEGSLYIDKVINITQSPIGRTPRSNPSTYTGIFTHIRELFSKLPESNLRGYRPGRFSFNVKGGRCESCEGGGVIKIEMHFLADMYIECEQCNGKRYNRDTLEISYNNKNIFDVLDMTVDDALDFFVNHQPIKRKLQTLKDVGLGYIKLGQSAITLSGGESQRVKLSTELSKIGTGRTLYILDEPTTGLHFEDIKMLLSVIQRLVDNGNTVIVIEHNMDIIKSSDWIIDLGPEGGDEGGMIVAEGTPHDVSLIKDSYTGQFLAKEL